MKEYSLTDTAKLVRQALKRTFPGTKFTVRSRSYSGGSSIDVRWMDGPTSKSVQRILDQFEGADFDGMQDLKTYREPAVWNGEQVRFHVDFIHGQREISYERMLQVAQRICEEIKVPMVTVKKSDYDGSGYVADGDCHVDWSWLSIEDADKYSDPAMQARARAKNGLLAHDAHHGDYLRNLIHHAAHTSVWEVPADEPNTPQAVTDELVDAEVQKILGGRVPLKWEQAAVGCYWSAGDFRISIFAAYRGGNMVRSGYRLGCKFEPMGDFEDLSTAMKAAEAIYEAEAR